MKALSSNQLRAGEVYTHTPSDSIPVSGGNSGGGALPLSEDTPPGGEDW